jgi:hypothetical protein
VTWPNDVITRTVTGTYLTGAGAPAKGRVTFTPTARVVDENDAVVIEDTLTAALDINGSFEIDLPTTDNLMLSPQGWAYQVNVRLYGVKPQKFFAVLPYGDGTPVDLKTGISGSASSSLSDASGSYAARGPVGPRGPGVLIDDGAPSDAVGFDGDIYINNQNGNYYGPKANGAWPITPAYSISGSSRHIHTQAAPSASWSITHALGGYPSVMVVDSARSVVIGEVIYNSTSSVTVAFSSPFSGYAYLT